MGNRMTKGQLTSLVRVLLFSALVLAFFFSIDRVFFRSAPEGWIETTKVGGPPPAYLTKSLEWPPKRILTRKKPEPGWWWGINESRTQHISVWIGSGAEPVPDEMKELAPCLQRLGATNCPDGWSFTSVGSPQGTVFILSRMGAAETDRMALGLQLSLKP